MNLHTTPTLKQIALDYAYEYINIKEVVTTSPDGLLIYALNNNHKVIKYDYLKEELTIYKGLAFDIDDAKKLIIKEGI